MTVTIAIPIGIVTAIQPNVSYALPVRATIVASAAAVKVSLSSTTGFTALTDWTTGEAVCAMFIQTVSTTQATTVLCKEF